MCASARSPNGELSEYIADIVEAAKDARGTEECISTEDLLSVIDSVSEKILEENLNDDELFIGSLDAEALYPSLEIDKCSKICAEMVASSGLKIDGLDYKWACKYVALALDPKEVLKRELQDIIPRKKARAGKNQTLRTVT